VNIWSNFSPLYIKLSQLDYQSGIRKFYTKTDYSRNELDNYNDMVNVIWAEIVTLRSNFINIEKIENFPFSTFVLPDTKSSSFWNFVYAALFESCINKIWNLVYSNPNKFLTLETLRKTINDEYIKEEYKEAFEKNISSIMSESHIEDLKEKVTRLRNHLVSHLQLEFNKNLEASVDKFAINLLELKNIILTANKLFQVLCFNSKGTLPIDLLQSQDGLIDSDLDSIFDSIVKNSDVFKMPEEQSGFWPSYRENLSSNDMKIINKYRKKFGLEEI